MSDPTPHLDALPQLVSADKVAYRCLVLATLLNRLEMELQTISEELDVIRQAQADLETGMLPWLRSTGAWDHASESERELIEAKIGAWNQNDHVSVSWRNEALSTLLWCLNLVPEFAPFDDEWDWSQQTNVLPLGDDPSSFLAGSELRRADEIELARRRAEIWHWRARTEYIARGYLQLAEPIAYDLDKVVRESATGLQQKGYIWHVIDEDFAALGKAYREATREQASKMMSIAIERHYALNWCCSFAENWDEVPTGT